MQSNRIISVQKRAKRRFLALAIVATAFAWYGDLSTLAQDDRPVQLPIEKMSKAPGVKAVGIRLISASGNSNKLPPAPLIPPAVAALPAPLAQPVALTTAPLPQPAGIDSMILSPATVNSTANFPASEIAPPPFYTSLPSPPRMIETRSTQPVGKVTMKINGVEPNDSSLPAKESAADYPNSGNSDTVDIRGVPNRSMGQPAKMPPFLIDPSKRVVAATEKPRTGIGSATQLSPGAIRMSFGDNAANNSDLPPKSRTPQLVKSKPTQLDHTVTLALSTEIESRKVDDEPEIYSPSVEVDASLVPHAISVANKSNKPKSNLPQAVITDAVPDAFVTLAAPTKELQLDLSRTANQAKGVGTDPADDRSRRKFDSRPAYQEPIATVDLECLAATTMDLAGKLIAIAVQDENVCKVLNNERTVSLVGNQLGTSLVQIWTADLGEKPQVVRVNVYQQGGKFQAKSTEVKDIKQVIAQSFPKANVSILSKEDGGIEVRGTTDTEESARRILELVRKLYLVPVKDSLTVSN